MKLISVTYFNLFNNKISPWKYCLISLVLTIIPSLVIIELLAHIFKINFNEKLNPIEFKNLFDIIEVILLGPLIETFLIAFNIHWLNQVFKKSFSIIIASTFIFAAFHFNLNYPIWFFGVLWLSFILSIAFYAWKFTSFWKAYTVCAIIHILHNGVIYILMNFFSF